MNCFKSFVASTIVAMLSVGAIAAEMKDPNQRPSSSLRRAEVATLSNGKGDGTVQVKVNGFGAFGFPVASGDAIYDPFGDIGPAGTVYESAIYVGIDDEDGQFLFTSYGNLPPPTLVRVSTREYRSRFSVGDLEVSLTQKLRNKTSKGSTFEQTYYFKNTSSTEKKVTIVRHVDGDLYFVGNESNDFGGVSADGKTLYEFDSGDDPRSPVTFVGISSRGGQSTGYAINAFRYTDDIVGSKGIPPDDLGKVLNDENGDGVTDSTYDITLSQQNVLTIPAGNTKRYITTTIFGEGSIADVTSSVSGCIKFNNEPLSNRTVYARQSGVTTQKTKTDGGGCFTFDTLRKGKTFEVTVSGPRVP